MDIEKILQANQALISGEKRAKFEQFRSLLLEYNQKYNLTSITDERDVFYKHFLDSSAGTGLFQEGASVAEVGSGAGFPSVVLKLLREDLSFTLLESVGKKCEFLRVVVDNLGLKGKVRFRRRESRGQNEYFERILPSARQDGRGVRSV